MSMPLSLTTCISVSLSIFVSYYGAGLTNRKLVNEALALDHKVTQRVYLWGWAPRLSQLLAMLEDQK